MRYIGDIHGRADLYAEAIDGCDESIQVGDFGFGWPVDLAPTEKHRFIRGNHDNPALAKLSHGYIESGPEGDHFFVGGGWSIDWMRRTHGKSWWPDEQHSLRELGILLEQYCDEKPTFMITHEAPFSVAEKWFPLCFHGQGAIASITSIYLDRMLDRHQPDFWIFGHRHETRSEAIGRTIFTCLGEGDWMDLTRPNLATPSPNSRHDPGLEAGETGE